MELYTYRTVTEHRRGHQMRKQQAPQAVKAYRNVAAYLRVSTDEQADSGLGIASQRTRVTAMCAAKGWPAPTVYSDDGVSGTKPADKRPALARLLEDVRGGKVDAVVILSLDRLGRKTRLVLDLVDELAHAGCALVSCKEALDTATPQGAFVLTMFAALAQLERDLIAERTRAALQEHSRRDGEAGGKLPYGYLRTGDGVVVDEEAVPTVRYVFGCHKRRDSLRAIAAKLNARGVPGPRGGLWWATSVREVLDNRAAYTGHARGLSEVRWPAILAA
jgi:site-specific DNA recombinase